ncbi:tetratricopeptide repeat protein [Aquimarina sp. MAR_2010_214]|uniref:AraC family transcriptional regulator n=1 Tax=Aquimarina sp. MAR_2010_214 TaxID=1250026 RepID=UPI000C70C174|nr:AraC family transcriptional regulator [Aquimarina sp. MAR_2010_214]PKV48665.1 tetratricopeptide repeat protein [Aquimarina sp. MAR_2010_214]
MHLKLLRSIIILSISFIGYGQSFRVSDSLMQKTYKQLSEDFHTSLDDNKSKAILYVHAYFKKGKNSKDSSRIAWAYVYKSLLYNDSKKRKIAALDSAIFFGKNIVKKNHPEVFYNKRGIAYGEFGDLNNSFKDYLTALDHSRKNNNTPYIYLLKHNIANLKRKLGKYDEAKRLFKECITYEKSIKNKTTQDTISYLLTLTELISVYRLSNQIDSAKILNKEGIKLSKSKPVEFLFDLNDGILDYYDQEYNSAVNKIKTILPKIINPERGYESTTDLINAYLYLGNSNKNLGKTSRSITCFKKIDSVSKTLNYFLPESRLAYVELVDYYKSIGDHTNQLLYINKLLSADSILTKDYRIVSDKLLREFDTRELLEQKQKIITSLEKENRKISSQNIIISILLLLSLIGISYYYYRQQLYKKRFLKLLHQISNQNQKKNQSNDDSSSSSINKETLDKLLDNLQQFEEKKAFLRPLTSKDLAKSFGSNSSYLSKVVNTFKEKSFSNYINDLRIDFVIDKLNKDSMFRKYTVQAIAQEIGFNNSEAFSKAFYKKTGIYPSYFIKKLEKQKNDKLDQPSR